MSKLCASKTQDVEILLLLFLHFPKSNTKIIWMKMEANILIWGKKEKIEYWEIIYLLIFLH